MAPPVRVDPRLRSSFAMRLRRIFLLRRIVLAIVLVCMLPLTLGLVYRVEFIHPVSTIMVSRWLSGQSVERQWVDIDHVAPVVVHSVMMSEDGQFCFHHGVDWTELNAVINDALEGEKPRGASTIPMQVAKNLFLWTGRSFIRKGIEIPLALYLDFVLPKKRIMEIYLNIAEWDKGVFGVEAASRHYFNTHASRLSASQAALLTVTLPNPEGRNPARPTRGLLRLAGIIRRRAARSGGYIGCLK